MILNMEKPFNLILGEVFQGQVNGNLLYCEQITHHPHLYQDCMDWVEILNQLVIWNLKQILMLIQLQDRIMDICKLYFQIIFNVMAGVIQGITIGQRQFQSNGVGWLVDLENKLFCDIIVTAFPGMFNCIEGYIMKGSVKDANKFNQETYSKYQGIIAFPQQDRLSNISDGWTTGMIIDGVEVFNQFIHFPYKLKYEEQPLAYDSNCREDLITLKTGDLNLAQDRKENMEIDQRHDKMIRQKKKH